MIAESQIFARSTYLSVLTTNYKLPAGLTENDYSKSTLNLQKEFWQFLL